MSDNLYDSLLKNRKQRLEWWECWPGLDDKGEKIECHIKISATVEDCIAIQRTKGDGFYQTNKSSDKDVLLDFMATKWAMREKDNA